MKPSDIWEEILPIQWSIDHFRSAVDRMILKGEESIEQLKVDLKVELDLKAEELPTHLHQQVLSMQYAVDLNIVAVYKQTLWQSIFVSQIAFVEATLKKLADVANFEKFAKKIKDPTSDYFRKYHDQFNELFFMDPEIEQSFGIKEQREQIEIDASFIRHSSVIRGWLVHGRFKNWEMCKTVLDGKPSIMLVKKRDTPTLVALTDSEYVKELNSAVERYLQLASYQMKECRKLKRNIRSS